jgi:hypothetical protein
MHNFLGWEIFCKKNRSGETRKECRANTEFSEVWSTARRRIF